MKETRKVPSFVVMNAGVLTVLLALSILNLQSQSTAGTSHHKPPPPIAYEPPGDPGAATEAPATFDPNNNNGLLSDADFVAARAVFDEVELIADGLGPTYNAQSCRECHQNVLSGGDAQATEVRSVRYSAGRFFESLGGSLIQARATFPDIVERVGRTDTVRDERKSVQVLGDGFVECIANNTLLALSRAQPSYTNCLS